MNPSDLETVPEDSPQRCHGVSRIGQCRKKKVEGSDFCPLHLGSSNGAINRQKIRNYNLTKFRDRVHSKADSPNVNSLREEVGMLRIILEEIWNSCTDEFQLTLQANKITDIMIKLQKLVKDCHSLEKSLGMYLDKTIILKLAGDIITIITDHVEDAVVAEAIAVEITEKIINAQPSQVDDGETD